MKKSGIQNSEHNITRIKSAKGSTVPEVPSIKDLLESRSFEKNLEAMLSALKARDQGAQAMLRQDLAAIYEVADNFREEPVLFKRFAEAAIVKDLPRAPKKPEQSLHALLKLAYDPKMASARHCRLKALWNAKASAKDVLADLEKLGSSPKGYRVFFDPKNLADQGISSFPVGAEVGLTLMAVADASNRLVCTVIYAECSRPI